MYSTDLMVAVVAQFHCLPRLTSRAIVFFCRARKMYRVVREGREIRAVAVDFRCSLNGTDCKQNVSLALKVSGGWGGARKVFFDTNLGADFCCCLKWHHARQPFSCPSACQDECCIKKCSKLSGINHRTRSQSRLLNKRKWKVRWC